MNKSNSTIRYNSRVAQDKNSKKADLRNRPGFND